MTVVSIRCVRQKWVDFLYGNLPKRFNFQGCIVHKVWMAACFVVLCTEYIVGSSGLLNMYPLAKSGFNG